MGVDRFLVIPVHRLDLDNPAVVTVASPIAIFPTPSGVLVTVVPVAFVAVLAMVLTMVFAMMLVITVITVVRQCACGPDGEYASKYCGCNFHRRSPRGAVMLEINLAGLR